MALEPRVLQLHRHIKWLERGYYNWNAVFAPYNSTSPAQDRVPREGTFRLPTHLRMVVTPAVAACLGARWDGKARDVHAVPCAKDTAPACPRGEGAGGGSAAPPPAAWEAAYDAACAHALDLRWTHRGLQHESSGARLAVRDAEEGGDEEEERATGPDHAVSCEDGAQTSEPSSEATPPPELDAAAAWEALHSCSAVVAMHPDQATEFAVDVALALGVPFAVVPCCVYASDFPRRRLPDGRRVTSYDDFIQYLCAKHPDIATATLPFEGKNTLVYRC